MPVGCRGGHGHGLCDANPLCDGIEIEIEIELNGIVSVSVNAFSHRRSFARYELVSFAEWSNHSSAFFI